MGEAQDVYSWEIEAREMDLYLGVEGQTLMGMEKK
jgi:hypothetical protein